jgi:hypothetical protein
MSRLFTAVVVTAGFVVIALSNGWSLTSGAATGPATVRVTTREVSRVRVDAGRRGKGPGDTEIVRVNLFNKRIKRQPIGHADSVCTYVTSQTRSCSVTIFLPKGRLVAGGSIRFPEFYELAVLGGTRRFDNARGTLTAIRTTRRPRRYILVFRLTG